MHDEGRRTVDNTLFLVLVLSSVCIGMAVFLHINRERKLELHFAQQQELLTTAYHASIEMYHVAMDGFYTNIISRPDILAMFAEGLAAKGAARAQAKDRLYRGLYPQYQAMQAHKLLQLHFHQADGTSYLRFHKPDLPGDALPAIRHTVKIANTEDRHVYGFEVGSVCAGFRYVYPIDWQGRHLGSVTASVSPQAVIDAMNRLLPGREYVLLIDRRRVDAKNFAEQRCLYHASALNPDFLVEDAHSATMAEVDHKLRGNPAVKVAMKQGDGRMLGVSVGTRQYMVTLLPIREIEGDLAAYLIAYTSDASIGTIREEFAVYMLTATLAMGLVTVLLLGLRQRSAALSRERHNLKVMSDTLAEGVYVTDPKGMIRQVNPAACRMMGYEVGELINRHTHNRFHRKRCTGPGCQEACDLFRHVSRGKPYDGEEEFTRKDGSMLTVKIASRPIMVDGRFGGSVTAFHDISARKRTEAALRKSEETARKLSTAVEQSPASVVITDLTGCIEYVNPKFVEKTGYTAEEAIGQNPRILQAGTMAPQVYKEMWQTLSVGREWKGELHNRRKNGELYWELASISPIRDHGGVVTHYLAVKEDVTEHKRMEEELREQELIQRTFMESMPVGLMIIDAETRTVERANPTAMEMFGVPAEAIVGSPCQALFCTSEAGPCPILDHGQTEDSSDRILVRHDGSHVQVLKTVSRIAINGREKLLECFIDISSRIAAETALKAANTKLKAAIVEAERLAEEAEAANRSKSIFLANMSHEIRTPLNAILGYSQLLQQDRSLGREQREQVVTINRSGDHLLALINGILEMSKIDAGHIKVQTAPLNFRRLLDDIDSIFRLTCRKKSLSLDMQTIGDIPDRIVADHGKVRQILVNLMANAVKFTARGGIRLRAAARWAGAGQWQITIDIVDSGSGIDEAEQTRLFQAFEQTASGRSAAEGTGLGLAISRAYARAMGGELELQRSAIGQGSVFRFTFPAGQDMHAGCGDIAAAPHVVIGQPTEQAKVRVLIIEDDAVSRRLLEKLLVQAGFDVHSVDSGEAGLAAMPRLSPAVVLLDVRLPGIDGYETARQIRRLPGGGQAKIISVTASGMTADELRRQAMAAGIDDIVAKPYKVDDILMKIRDLCGIAYVYETPSRDADVSAGGVPAATGVDQLPAALREALKSAVELGDMAAFDRLAEKVAAIDNLLGSRLSTLAHQFDYTALLDILSPTAETQSQKG